MGTPIALILNGGPSDLPTSIYAVLLAARSGSKLYALHDCLDHEEDNQTINPKRLTPFMNRSRIDSFSFLVEFADIEEIQVSCHLLEDATIEHLFKFLLAHDITCLLTGNDKKQKGRKEQLTELQRRYADAGSDLQIITAPLWEEDDMTQVIRQSFRLDRLNTKKK